MISYSFHIKPTYKNLCSNFSISVFNEGLSEYGRLRTLLYEERNPDMVESLMLDLSWHLKATKIESIVIVFMCLV